MAPDILRDSAIGSLLNYATNGKIFPFADQRSDYVVPARYLPRQVATSTASSAAASTLDEEEDDLGKVESGPEKSTAESSAFVVTWEENDSDNPRNWSFKKRVFVGWEIAFMTTAVYIGSAIYTASIEDIIATFDVNQVVATLGLSLIIFGYGVGPMLLSPLADVVAIGRTPIYIVGLFLYVLFQVPVILAPNIATLLVFRFLAGFVGSPALSTGGTSMTELFPIHLWAYAIGAWALGAVCGPVLGPVIGGFAAQANGWRWPIYELLWISGFALILLSLLLPETSEKTILYRRAMRLRKLTGNSLLRSQHELDAGRNSSILSAVRDNFVIGLKIARDPAIGFANLYIGLVYAIFYLWFETFPVVFSEIHHFNLGLSGLPYLGFLVMGALTFTFYALYNKLHMVPRLMRGDRAPENRLELGLFAGCFVPVSLLVFGWGAKAHWIVPIIGAALYFPGIYLLFQSILMFISTYVRPEFNSAVMASNAFFRCALAAAFPLFGKAYVDALGVGPACSLLAGVSVLMVPVLWLLWRNGKTLRRRSAWANKLPGDDEQ